MAIGGGIASRNPAETISFDTNLDGAFADTVRTAAGASAFSPGFCGGLAINAMAVAGCTNDKNGTEIGIRGGVDRSQGPAPATNAFILVNAAGTDFRRTQDFEFHSVRVGLNYRF